LLGRIYSDRGEAPQALQCYNDAVEKADTLSEDCDYTTLYKVYGQMADVFEAQVMPNEEIEALKRYSQYALKAGNTYEYIRGIEFMAGAYSILGDTTMLLSTEQKAHVLYKEHGFLQAAASAYTLSIYVYIARGNYQKAYQFMQLYEKESGLFDEDGSIQQGREGYYLCKGLYYLGINHVDTAESYFKKLINNPQLSFNAYQGLISVSQKKGDASTALSYLKKYEASFDTLITNIHADATRQVKGLYDYTRQQKIAQEKAAESEHNRNVNILLIVCFTIVAFMFFRLFWNFRMRKRHELAELNCKYAEIATNYEKEMHELDLIQTDFSAFKEQKLEELSALKQQMQEMRDRYGNLLVVDNPMGLMQCPSVVTLLLNVKKPGILTPLTDEEWGTLITDFQKHMPLLFTKLRERHLSKLETRATIMTRLGVGTDEMAYLFGTRKQNITNYKREANFKLYADKSAHTLFANLDQL
jgi:tetratricopeptide (TPR) repeat protein